MQPEEARKAQLEAMQQPIPAMVVLYDETIPAHLTAGQEL